MANAYTATADVAGLLPNFYDKVFLERLQPGPIMMQYCVKKPLPQNSGKVMYFPRMVTSSTMVSAYKQTEGTVLSTEKIDEAQVSATVEQFANAKALWDLTELTAINSTVEETVKEIGDQANNIIDKRIIHEAYGTSSLPWGGGFSVTAYNTAGDADLGASTSAYFTYVGTSEFRLADDTIRYLTKKLRARNVRPMDDGLYVLVCHSDSAMQLQSSTVWQTAYQYTDPENLRKGVAGSYGGMKIQIDNNILTSAMGSASKVLYFSIAMGQGALGVSMLDGGIKTFTKSSGPQDTFNPVNQFITFGWKINFVPKILNVSCGLIVVTADE